MSTLGDEALHALPFPRYTVALLQSESEMLLVPAADIAAFLRADARWDDQLYTDRSAQALVDSATQFDCIVVGYNALHKSKVARDALADHPLETGLCVLHQLSRGSLAFLRDELAVDVVRLREPIDRIEAAAQLQRDDEILLNWSSQIEFAEDGSVPGARVFCTLTPGPRSEWRTILEVADGRRRHPVLLRTRSGRWPPVVVSTVVLTPHENAHAALLGNMILWCAAGRPEAVILDPHGTDSAAIVHRKLRLQGTKAISYQVREADELDFDAWPLRGVADVVLPDAQWDPTEQTGWPERDPTNARRWLRGGGRLVRLGPGESLTVRHGQSDAHWVLQRWAAWYHATPPEQWHGRGSTGSIVASRAVLRVLGALELSSQTGSSSPAVHEVLVALAKRGSQIEAERLGLPPPRAFDKALADLLRRRVGHSDHVEWTISTTAAALDIDELLGGEALGSDKTRQLRDWLRERFERAAAEDKLEIARRLGERELLLETIAELTREGEVPAPLSAARVTKLREAIVACHAQPEDISPLVGEAPLGVLQRGLRISSLLSAGYLLAVRDLNTRWKDADHPLLTPSPRVIDQAVITLGKRGPLAQGVAAGIEASAEAVSVEALALIAYFGRHPVPTHVIRRADVVPPPLVAAVLTEMERLRAENAVVIGQRRAIDRARSIIGLTSLLLIAGVLILAWWTMALAGVPRLARAPFELVLLGVVVLAVFAALGKLEVSPWWAEYVIAQAEGGRVGLKRTLARVARGQPRNGE